MSAPLPNLTRQLSQLLNFTGKVATAIRMYSAYNECFAAIRPQHLVLHGVTLSPQAVCADLMYLSDCLHGFEGLGAAVLSTQVPLIDLACSDLISAIAEYKTPRFISKGDPRETFERWSSLFTLDEADAIIRSIRAELAYHASTAAA